MPNNQAHDTRTTNPANRVVQAVGLQVAANMVPAPTPGVIFQDNFDAQPDWNSGLPENDKGGLSMGGAADGGWDVDIAQVTGTHTIPQDWYAVRQTPVYAPSLGDADRHEVLEIVDASTVDNINKVRNGAGKSLVAWRDSDSLNRFHSDGILMKYWPNQSFQQLYIEFWFNMSAEMIATYYDATPSPYAGGSLNYGSDTTGLGKLFRVFHYDGQGELFSFHSDGGKYPIYFWQFEGRPESANGYGFRNAQVIYPRRTDQYDDAQSVYVDHNGNPSNDLPSSYHPITTTRYGDGPLLDMTTGLDMPDNQGSINIDQVFGDESQWARVAFFVKMNSAPGARDGQLMQWINDRRMTNLNNVQWVASTRNMVEFNGFALGGNDYFAKYDNAVRHEHWYAYDDLIVSGDIPDRLKEPA